MLLESFHHDQVFFFSSNLQVLNHSHYLVIAMVFYQNASCHDHGVAMAFLPKL